MRVIPAPSSPRERGSSAVRVDLGQPRRVVPARAGVIRTARVGPWPSRSRPRASGGHPASSAWRMRAVASSPRERGSSSARRTQASSYRVVPARAGVIPWACSAPPTPRSRPRASGGHPLRGDVERLGGSSSPRERGSSLRPPPDVARTLGVPARAGVIRSSSPSGRSSRSRPRASGGHPDLRSRHRRARGSSPRERGSSGADFLGDGGPWVVPARAGVIRRTRRSSGAEGGRPRASGGHPCSTCSTPTNLRSSPRERGSSGVVDPRRAGRGVVPARAGVIPEED